MAVRYAYLVSAQVGSATYVVGSAFPATAATVAAAGNVALDNILSLATATNLVLYNSASAPYPSDFEWLLILSDKDLSVEVRGTTAADNSNLTIKANIPFILASNQTRAYNAAGGFAGAAQSVTLVTVNNASGSTAVIRRQIFT
jgi:hypothetical protein